MLHPEYRSGLCHDVEAAPRRAATGAFVETAHSGSTGKDEYFPARHGRAASRPTWPPTPSVAFKALLKAQPRHAGALNLLGIILTQQGRFAGSRDVREAGFQRDTELRRDALQLRHPAEERSTGQTKAVVLQRFSQALVINPGVVAVGWNNQQGNIYIELGCYQEAIADFDKAIAINPNHAAAKLLQQSHILGRAQDLRSALPLAAFEQAACVGCLNSPRRWSRQWWRIVETAKAI